MKRWLQRIRGALGTALTWAAGWSGVGALIGLLLWVTSAVATGPGATVGYMVFALAGVFAAAGFIGGAILFYGPRGC